MLLGKGRARDTKRERKRDDLGAEGGKYGESVCIKVKPNRSKISLDNERTRWRLGEKDWAWTDGEWGKNANYQRE